MKSNSRRTTHANPAVLVFAAFIFIAFVALAIVSQTTAVEFSASPRILPPLALIFIGLVLIEAETWKSVVLGLLVSIVVFVLAALVLVSFQFNPLQRSLSILGPHDDMYVIPNQDQIEVSILEIDVQNTELTVNGSSGALIESSHKSDDQILTIEEILAGGTHKTTVRSGDLHRESIGEPAIVELNLAKDKKTHLLGTFSDTKAELNLAGVQLEGLNLDLSNSEAKITIGDGEKSAYIKIHNDHSDIRFKLPESASVVITEAGEVTYEGGSGTGGDIHIEYTGEGVDPVLEWY